MENRAFQVGNLTIDSIDHVNFLGVCSTAIGMDDQTFITHIQLIFLENFRDSTLQRQLYPIVSGPMFPKDPFSRWRSYPCVGRLGQVGGWSIHGRR